MLCHVILPYIFIRYVSSVVDCYVFCSGIYGWMKLGSASKNNTLFFCIYLGSVRKIRRRGRFWILRVLYLLDFMGFGI